MSRLVRSSLMALSAILLVATILICIFYSLQLRMDRVYAWLTIAYLFSWVFFLTIGLYYQVREMVKMFTVFWLTELIYLLVLKSPLFLLKPVQSLLSTLALFFYKPILGLDYSLGLSSKAFLVPFVVMALIGVMAYLEQRQWRH